MKVVIAEKPSVGKDLAKVLGASKAKDGYIEGNGIAFTWAFGHLIQLAGPQTYGFESWSKENLPMLPSPFQLVPKQKKVGKEWVTDPGVRKQINIIRTLFSKADEIVVATDAGREGELIFRYIYNYLGCKKPFKRLWISSQTDKAIREGFAALKPGAHYNALYEAAKARSESDWLVGLNATQALSVAAGGKGVYSLGRVQTPTLAMICRRYLEYKNFKPEIYFQLSLELEKDNKRFVAVAGSKYRSKEEGDKVLETVRRCAAAEVTKVETKERTEDTPLLYDLTTLQQDANKRFGFTAEKTLQLAQRLYERKFITYPRTGSRYIGDDVFATILDLLKVLEENDRFRLHAAELRGKKLSKRSVNASKVTDHHALLITEVAPSGLSAEENSIYELVAGRMLEAFGEKCVKDVTTVELIAGEMFMAKGVVIKRLGWRGIFNAVTDDEEGLKGLPELKPGDKATICEYRNDQKQTKPKPLFTEASLLEAMKTCGREIDDDDVREAMKDSGLGTPATRAAIIERLFGVGYIQREKKSIIPSHKGLAVYDLVKEKPISSPEMTGAWEKKLLDIEKQQFDSKQFMSEIIDYTKELTKDLFMEGENVKTTEEQIAPKETLSCPKCNVGTIQFIDHPRLSAAKCSEDREACGFIIFREVAKKKLSDPQLMSLIKNKRTSSIKGFVGKKGQFEATLLLTEDFKVVFDFGEKSAKATPTVPLEMGCPKCEKALLGSEDLIQCSECDFRLYKTIAKKRIPDAQIEQLLSTGRTDVVKGLKSKAGKEFECRFAFDAEFKLVFEFDK